MFDEILLYGPHYLNKIFQFMNATDKKIYATGDVNQLQPFAFQLNNVSDAKKYLSMMIDIMFLNQIILQQNKRLQTKEDQLLLDLIKNDIFDLNMDVSTTMKKYFKTIRKYSQLKTSKNISFFNFRSETINKMYQKMFHKEESSLKCGDFYYYNGLELYVRNITNQKSYDFTLIIVILSRRLMRKVLLLLNLLTTSP